MRLTGMVRLLLVPLLLLAAACGASDGTADGSDTAVPGLSPGSEDSLGSSDRPANDLAVAIDRGDGSPPEQYTLVCAVEASGTHPSPQQACEHLERAGEPFAPLPADRFCTEQYGGPQTAHITGLWQGTPVDLQVARTDGCEIAQWDSLGPLLPGPAGVEDPAVDVPQ